MVPDFISALQKKRCNYNHPDQATSQANSLILLSSGIYTEEERFVFELLQNAVDAHSDSPNTLNVRMVIKDDYFIFMHNGAAFTERDIEGLCDVGNGNKMKYDIRFTSHEGKEIFVEVKATTWSKQHQENMPISYRELTMVEECNGSERREYYIVRVFGIGQPNQDIYIFNGCLLNIDFNFQ